MQKRKTGRVHVRLAPWTSLVLLASACVQQDTTSSQQQALALPDVQVTDADQTELPFTLANLPGSGLDAYLTFRAPMAGGSAWKKAACITTTARPQRSTIPRSRRTCSRSRRSRSVRGCSLARSAS